MAAIKIPANVNNSAGNSGLYNPLFSINYTSTGTPAAVTAAPIFTVPCTATLVGVSFGLTTPGTTITFDVKKVTVAAQTATSVCSTNAIITSSATGTGVEVGAITKEGVASTWATGSGTGITAPVLKTDGTVSFVAGDVVTLTTSGTFTSGVNLHATLYFRDDSGSI